MTCAQTMPGTASRAANPLGMSSAPGKRIPAAVHGGKEEAFDVRKIARDFLNDARPEIRLAVKGRRYKVKTHRC